MKVLTFHTVKPNGFALVVTLSMLSLLMVAVLGLLSLATISQRSANNTSAEAEAKANARMALMLAIGELQTQMGPDQRISANSSILDESTVNHPHWTGVWDAWKAGPSSAEQGNPSEPSAHQTIPANPAVANGMHPTYEPNRQDHFRGWLLSLNPEESTNISAPIDLQLDGERAPAGDVNAVQLVGEGSLGTENEQQDSVSVRLLPVKKSESGPISGRYGWWVGDESQKARLTDDSYASQSSLTAAERIFRHQSPGSTGTRTVNGLADLDDDSQLAALPSLKSLDLVRGADGRPSHNFHSVTPYSYQVLADVREGGLRRDLSALLERTISENERGDEFMLYKFNNNKDAWITGNPDFQESVPIQDLAAYYQLYNGYRPDWKEGVLYSSNLFPNAMQVISPHFGDSRASGDPAYFREYTTLYRQPVLLKVQFLLSMFAQPIPGAPQPSESEPDPFTHYLRIGVSPSVTFWNPTNIPMSMRFEGDVLSQNMRFNAPPLRFRWSRDGGDNYSAFRDLTWYSYNANNDDSGGIFNLYFSGQRPITFEPGQVKTFSLGYSGDVANIRLQQQGGHVPYYRREFLFKTDRYFEPLEVFPGWEPQSAVLYNRSAHAGDLPDEEVEDIRPGGPIPWQVLKIKKSDLLTFEIDGKRSSGIGAFNFFINQTNHQSYTQYGGTARWHRRHYVFASRSGDGGDGSFNERVITKGFPSNQQNVITQEPRLGDDLISKGDAGWPFMLYSLQAGVETNQSFNGFIAAGRNNASRPFLHSSAIGPPFIDDITEEALYNTGWNWSVEPIGDIFEVPIMVSPNDEGFYGGGNTPENGTTHVIQQEIPVTPPIAIASLSHAHLGGFSLATWGAVRTPNDSGNPTAYHQQNVAATGQGGLFPHTLQAIGNSYAHPNLPADKAYETQQRIFSTSGANSGPRNITFADHSYLANKALWDEFFFSSISPQPSAVRIFEGQNRTADEVAEDFFFNDTPLPNRRMVPYTANLDESRLDDLFGQANQFQDGLADKIAAHLMVEGAFNVNSTSVEAWKTFLSSLKGKPVAYLDKKKAPTAGVNLDEATPDGTPVGATSLLNGEPVSGSSNDPSDPEQWTHWRELSDNEIEELAEAIVKQVKLRGPFLSLSEFVNRRLDSSNPELSAKGALQAAIDDPDVSINAGFRSANRTLDSEVGASGFAFQQAARGPIAYGSSAYVDQADILRNFAEQLTPRGDTFVIRTYGDALDANGNVVARAWCEAVVQRMPEYLDPADEAHIKQADLTSDTNKAFGRKLNIVSFRWLDPSEL